MHTNNSTSRTDPAIRVLHITDNHLFVDHAGGKFGINSIESLRLVLTAATATETFDVVLATGDVAQDIVESVYAEFVDVLKQHLSIPIIGTPGNHDYTDLFRKYLPEQEIGFETWRIVSVDTHINDRVEGMVSQEEMDALESSLSSSDLPTLVIGHHPAHTIGCEWIDSHRVQNGEELLNLLRNHDHVKCYLAGHVHQACDDEVGGLRVLTTPSTCWQFKPNSTSFAIDDQFAGWRTFSLYSDGTFDTDVFRIDASL